MTRLGVSDFTAQILQAAVIAGISLLVLVWPELKGLRLFVAVILAWVVGYLAVAGINSTALWLDYRRHAPTYQWVMINSLVQTIPTLLMLALAVSAGLRRRDLFLVGGDLSARARAGMLAHLPWKRLIVPVAIGWAAISGCFLLLRVHGNPIATSRLLGALPIVVLFPILNSINEEIRFRNVFLAAGLPAVGATSVLWMTAVFFGLAHFGSFLGTSGRGGSLASGLLYGGGAAFFGLILGGATLDTKGVVAAWVIHAASDLVLILGYVLAF
jgi:membrane protease YdiL (CAAX protease family)